MATVPRYFRDKLVSSQTGTNTLDTSGVETARAIAQLAGEFQQLAVGEFQKQRAATDRSEVAMRKAEYVNRSTLAAQELQKTFAENPEAGYDALIQKNTEIKDSILSSVSRAGLRQEIGAHIDGLMAQQSIDNKQWQIQRMSAMDQQFLVDVQRMNIETIVQGATGKEYDIMLGDDTFTEENYKRAWGPETGIKNFQTARNAMFRARATTLMEQGRFFEAQDFIEKRTEPDAKTRREVTANFLKMQEGAKAKRFFETVSAASVDVVETQEGVIADDLTASQLDDRVLEVSARAAATNDPNVQRVLTGYAQILADIRDIKMENILLRAEGDTNVESRLQAQYENLFVTKDGVHGPNRSAYLSDFLVFQNEIVQSAKSGNVSAKNYNKWMFWSKVALQGIDPTKSKLDPDGKMKRKLKKFLKDSKGKSAAWRVNVMREVYENIPSDDMSLMSDEVLDPLFQRGKVVATLLDMGLPVDIMSQKVIKTSAGNFNVVGEDQDGMPIVDVSTMNMDR